MTAGTIVEYFAAPSSLTDGSPSPDEYFCMGAPDAPRSVEPHTGAVVAGHVRRLFREETAGPPLLTQCGQLFQSRRKLRAAGSARKPCPAARGRMASAAATASSRRAGAGPLLLLLLLLRCTTSLHVAGAMACQYCSPDHGLQKASQSRQCPKGHQARSTASGSWPLADGCRQVVVQQRSMARPHRDLGRFPKGSGPLESRALRLETGNPHCRPRQGGCLGVW